MNLQEIKGEDYSVQYIEESVTVKIEGELSLTGSADYAPITALLNEIAERNPPMITLDLKKLEFLNSSGISMLSKFAIAMRKKKTIQLAVIGSDDIPWQRKSLQNFLKLCPNLQLTLE
ncbi:hypothetical protein [Oscillatoria sp. HE19RPO]|uniref:slr1659 superfamily regulator n=1 Tax=Oscillatoria sp. HE19RPO TaxID=2954806 RepID=UPI0020C40B6A|nr:hypothetical protein [Oscillatoria sp. HE19RPO]